LFFFEIFSIIKRKKIEVESFEFSLSLSLNELIQFADLQFFSRRSPLSNQLEANLRGKIVSKYHSSQQKLIITSFAYFLSLYL